MTEKIRCTWSEGDTLYEKYHDEEWGKPTYDDQKLFEMLILEGAQAGLSWKTVLYKRENYRKAFDNFNVDQIVNYNEEKVAELLENPGIIRNRLKINSVITNAKAFKNVQETHGSFAKFLWDYVEGTPQKNHFTTLEEVPASTPLSDQISKDLKKLGFKFVGSKIIYAYMQSIGMVNDHVKTCFLYKE